MARVGVTFDGSSRGVVAAATETVTAISKVRKAADEQARDNIVKRVEERRSLEQLAQQYRTVAENAKRGSEVQITAARLERNALRDLADTHGVYVRQSKAGTASLAAHERELGRFTKGAVIGSGALGHLGRTAAIASGAFLGGVGVIQVLRSAVGAGSALQKQLERTTAVWNTNAGAVKSWSKDSATALGMARSDALDAANTIGTLLKNMDVAPGKALAMSKSITQLAADMAAFKGVKPEQALAALEAGLQGRTRSLKQFGIVLDQATIKQEAERLGLVKSTVDIGKVRDAELAVAIAKQKATDAAQKHGARSVEEAQALEKVHSAERALATAQAGHAEKLTNEQKALATYNLLVKQTADQQGTWAKRSKDLAGQQQILHAQVKDLQEQLGTALIPQLTHYLPLLTGWISRNEKNGTFQRDFNKIAKVTGEVVGGLVTVIKDVTKVFNLFGDAVGGDKKALELLAGVFVGAKLSGGISKIIGMFAGRAGLAASAATAEGEVAALSTGLAALPTAGIVIPIILAIMYRKQISDAISGVANSVLGALGVTPDPNLPTYQQWQHAGANERTVIMQRAKQGGITDPRALPGGPKASAGGMTRGDLGSAGSATAMGATGPVTGGVANLERALAPIGGHVTDDYAKSGHAKNSYHYRGEAIDFAVNANVWAALYARRGLFAELFGPTSLPFGGLYHYGVEFYDGPLQAEHQNHIHVAFTGSMATIDKAFAGGAVPPKTGGTTGGTTGTTTTDTGAGTGGLGTTFVEKAKAKKVKLTPLQRAIQTYGKTIDDEVARVNDNVAKGVLPRSLGDEIDQRAERLRQSLEHATKADLPKIKQQLTDLAQAIQRGLRIATDQHQLAADEKTIQEDLRNHLIPAGLATELEQKAKGLNERLAKDVFDPKKFAADEAAVRGLKATIARTVSDVLDWRNYQAEIAKAQTDTNAQIDQILGKPTKRVTQQAVEDAKAGAQKIGYELTHNILTAAQRQQARRQLTAYKQTIEQGLADAVNAVSDAKTKFEAAWTRLEDQQLTSFDEDTQSHLSAMQKSAQQALAKLQIMVKGSFGSFMFGGDITQTPTERLISQMQAQRQAQSDAQAISDARSQLATDQTSGASASQLAADQKAVDDAVYQQKLDDLQKQADAERTAADKQLADAQQNFTDQETIAEQAYQKQRDLQRTALQQQWDDEMAQVEEGKKPLAQALAELGMVAGSAFSTAYLAELATVYQSLEDLIAAANALSGATGSKVKIPQFNPVPKIKPPANISGFATGGWAGHGSRTIDPRDTIFARLRPGEYVMSPEEVAAGRPNWAGGGAPHVSFPNATFIGAPTREAAEAWAPAIQAAIERHDLGGGMRVHR